MINQYVAIVDDNEKTLELLNSIVSNQSGYKVLGLFTSGIDIIKHCKTQKQLPDIVLMDIQMPKFDGVQTTEYLFTFFPQIRIIAVSSYASPQLINDMFSCGVCSYVLKTILSIPKPLTSFATVLIKAIKIAAKGETYLDERLCKEYSISTYKSLQQKHKNEINQLRKRFKITKIEHEIICLNAACINYNEFANLTNKSARTIETQIYNLTKRIQSDSNRMGLLKFSLQHDLIKIARFSN